MIKNRGNSPFFIAEIYLVESVKLIVYNTTVVWGVPVLSLYKLLISASDGEKYFQLIQGLECGEYTE